MNALPLARALIRKRLIGGGWASSHSEAEVDRLARELLAKHNGDLPPGLVAEALPFAEMPK